MEKHRRYTMAVREFIGKTVVGMIVMIFILTMVFMITQTPIFTNDIAMNQMENSNDWFVAMTMYQRFAYAAGTIGIVSVIVILGVICWEGYKLAKILKSESTTNTTNEKEN